MTAGRHRGIPIVLARRGMRYATDDCVAFDALAPEASLLADGSNDVNDNSVVFRMTYHCVGCARPFRMLFTGDAGAASEARILAAGVEVEADVLKVGHHGSAHSSTPAFIAAARPRYALIRVGRHNLFGHPALTRARAAGSLQLQTAVLAAWLYAHDGNSEAAFRKARQAEGSTRRTAGSQQMNLRITVAKM